MTIVSEVAIRVWLLVSSSTSEILNWQFNTIMLRFLYVMLLVEHAANGCHSGRESGSVIDLRLVSV